MLPNGAGGVQPTCTWYNAGGRKGGWLEGAHSPNISISITHFLKIWAHLSTTSGLQAHNGTSGTWTASPALIRDQEKNLTTLENPKLVLLGGNGIIQLKEEPRYTRREQILYQFQTQIASKVLKQST